MSGITDKKLKSLKPKKTEYTVKDRDGLSISVMPSGTKFFRYRYMIKGTRQRYTYGRYGSEPNLSLEKARIMHGETRAKVKQGVDITEERKLKEDEKLNDPTLSQVAKLYYDDKLKKDWKHPELALELLQRDILENIGYRKINTITRKQIRAELKKILNRGSDISAKRTLTALKGYIAHQN
jgi:hypothetical protein